jgi:transposase
MVHASERERPDVKAKREIWIEMMPSVSGSQLVFLDESGVNTDMTRRYGRAASKERVVDHVPLNTPKSSTIISPIRLDGTTVSNVFEGALNGERFREYLTEHLVPTLKPGDWVVMDNLASHKVAGVADIIRAAGAIPVYLPPYSPDLNPIELMWSKIKAILRKLRLRSVEELVMAIPIAFSRIQPSDCAGWFSHMGYSC